MNNHSIDTLNEVERIHEALGFIPADNRDTWLKMGMAIKSAMGESGFEIWNQWSQQADSYNAQDAKDVWKSIHSDGNITVGTLYYEAKANGWCGNGELIAHKQKSEYKERHEEQANTASKARAIWSKATEVQADNCVYPSANQVNTTRIQLLNLAIRLYSKQICWLNYRAGLGKKLLLNMLMFIKAAKLS